MIGSSRTFSPGTKEDPSPENEIDVACMGVSSKGGNGSVGVALEELEGEDAMMIDNVIVLLSKL